VPAVEPPPRDEPPDGDVALAAALAVVDLDRLDVERGSNGRSHLDEREAVLLADCAKALAELHDRLCGCDSPGRPSYCEGGVEFAALAPP
jgi:hypothetical protein